MVSAGEIIEVDCIMGTAFFMQILERRCIHRNDLDMRQILALGSRSYLDLYTR